MNYPEADLPEEARNAKEGVISMVVNLTRRRGKRVMR
jgi:hypothetical protein